MSDFVRGVLGVGVTLFVLAAGMATVNGLVRGWSAKQLATNPDSDNAKALLMLF